MQCHKIITFVHTHEKQPTINRYIVFFTKKINIINVSSRHDVLIQVSSINRKKIFRLMLKPCIWLLPFQMLLQLSSDPAQRHDQGN